MTKMTWSGVVLIGTGILGMAVGMNEGTVASAAAFFAGAGFISFAAGIVLVPLGFIKDFKR